MGGLVVRLSERFRSKAQANLRIAGLDVPGRLQRCAREAGRAAGETPFVWFSPPERVLARVEVEGQAALEAARARGKGVILLTPHLGSFEVAARAAARSGPITVLYKPPRLPAVRHLVETGRQTPGILPAPANASGVRKLLRALKRGEAIGVLPDQVPSEGDGVWAPFFGRPAYTMTLPQRLARLTGAAVMMASGERLPQGRGWRVRFEPFEGEPSPQAINSVMEQLIQRMPDQYFWGYNRYKTPPRAEVQPALDSSDPGAQG